MKNLRLTITIIVVFVIGLFAVACSKSETENNSMVTPTYYENGEGNPEAASVIDDVTLKGTAFFSESRTYRYDGVGNYQVVTVACTKNPGVGPVESGTLISTVTQSPNTENGGWQVTSPPDEILETKGAKEQEVASKIAAQLSDQVGPRCKER